MLQSTCRQGKIFPHLACDTCGRSIESIGEAMVQVFRDGRVRIVHKSMNGRACDDRSSDGGWMPLDVFLCCLLRNLGFDMKHAMGSAKTWEHMGP